MSPPRLIFGLALAIALPGAAYGEDRAFCPDRPGMNTPPCTVSPGRVSAEASFADWTRENDPDTRTDTLLIGDMALRYGIADHAELRLGWTAYGHIRARDKASGAIATDSGAGDVTVGIKRNLVGPDMKGFSLALLPSFSLPTGGTAIGAGDWGAGLQVPVSVPLGGPLSFALTPQVDAAVNASRHGRHLAYGTAAGLSLAATGNLALAFEASVMRDDDPGGAGTAATAGVSAGWMLGSDCQVDLGGEFGLNANTPGLRISFGIARRF